MNDEEFGLPKPKEYDGEKFTVLDYEMEEYAEAKTLEEAIAIRGAKAFLRDVTPEDFLESNPLGAKKLGIAELWFDSTWRGGDAGRNVPLEKLVASVKEDDMLEVRRCSKDINEWGYNFYLNGETALPYTPYHDYDDQFFQRVLKELRDGEWLVCRVRGVECYGGDGVDHDPDFCWRVYSCKVTVYCGDAAKK